MYNKRSRNMEQTQSPQWEQQSTMNEPQQNRRLRTQSSLSHWWA